MYCKNGLAPEIFAKGWLAMAVTTRDAYFLGNFADADTNEATAQAENPNIYRGIFGSSADPLSSRIVSITFDDANDSNSISTNNTINGTHNDTLSYDLGTGAVTTRVDSIAVVGLSITYRDGSVVSYTNCVAFQDTSGNIFLANSNFAGTDINTNSLVVSVNITNVQNTNFAGLLHNAFQPLVCYASGTKIRTPGGHVLVEDLRIGDLVTTNNGNSEPIVWVGSRKISQIELLINRKLRPIKIEKGSLGPDLPSEDLIVSPQHRILIRSKIAKRMLDADEVLVAAKELCEIDGIYQLDDGEDIEYHHLMFRKHEVIFANGAEAESLFFGPEISKGMDREHLAEILEIFPELGHPDYRATPAMAILAGRLARKLVDRHKQNEKALVSC